MADRERLLRSDSIWVGHGCTFDLTKFKSCVSGFRQLRNGGFGIQLAYPAVRRPVQGQRGVQESQVSKTQPTVVAAAPFLGQAQAPGPAQVRIQRVVMHELLMLPYFGVFDNMEYQVNGDAVILLGLVTRPTLKSDAESVVKHIEVLSRANNNINVLPPSPMDDQLRLALFRAIYGYPSVEKYALGVQKAIRIIVKGGHVDLDGVVDSMADKETAGIRTNGVSGIFMVTNNLRVVPS
jgi:hyperosmotically inducible protein